jgi:hypothetical protein
MRNSGSGPFSLIIALPFFLDTGDATIVQAEFKKTVLIVTGGKEGSEQKKETLGQQSVHFNKV